MARPNKRAGNQRARTIRVRSRPLAEIDEAKLATALALMARRLLEQRNTEAGEDQPEAEGHEPPEEAS